MYAIKMNEDKSLVTTIQSTIYQNEKNADTLVFLLPKYYEEENLADCAVLLRYLLPDGTGKSEKLKIEPEPYNDNYYRYRLSITSTLTETVGTVELWLEIINMYDNLVLKSGTVFIKITPSKDITDYLSSKDLNQLDHLAAQIESLKFGKADGLSYDNETCQLQLTSNGTPIGQPVYVNSADNGLSITDMRITQDGELLVFFDDGSIKNLGKVIGKDGMVYVPHIDEHNVLTFTLEESPVSVPDPVDLNPNDEWSAIDGESIATDYVWEGIESS